MQYIGERTVRLLMVGSYSIENGKDRFLLDNDMMMKYLTNPSYSSNPNATYCCNGISKRYGDMSSIEREKANTYKYKKSELNNCERFKYNGKQYVKIKDWHNTSSFFVYEVLPAIFNDEIFKWSRNAKYDTLECMFVIGMFEFHCIYKNDGSAIVDVKYAKCDNRHRNRVTITTIYINDAGNESILEAVDYWKAEFKREIDGIA